jgi:hypothetical protein
MGVILLLFVLVVGVLYFRLHALPEPFAHCSSRSSVCWLSWPCLHTCIFSG